MYDLYKRIQKSVDFMESHLCREINLLEIAEKAFCSLYHFHRIFQALVGNSVAEYLRNRRLTSAARDLVRTGKPVLDIALDYQYGTPESFSRAFKKLYGLNPLAYRKQGFFEPLHQKTDLLVIKQALSENFKGGLEMKPVIRTQNEMKVLGYLLKTRHGECADQTLDFWREFKARDLGQTIPGKINPDTYFGVCYGVCDGCVGYNDQNIKDSRSFGYLICAEVDGVSAVPEGMTARKIPASKYAVFTAQGGTAKAREAADYIYKTWLPNTSYELAHAPDLELYDSSWPEDLDAKMEIWIPIR